MDTSDLDRALSKLRQELASGAPVDSETASHLHALVDEIDHLLVIGSEIDPARIESVSGRLQSAVLKFETEHPRVTVVMSQVIEGLASLGI